MAEPLSATLAVLLFLGTFAVGLITVVNEDYLQLPFIVTVPTVFFLLVSLILYKWFITKTRFFTFMVIAAIALAVTYLIANGASN
ncbi:hypothetical protein [Sporosarcina aquimarina]|uniref:Uncharacterized protein n=1 Tax=Sporosarcina aquimarina TaxID=114975 RepID=A0ABU4FZD5_9BACL|nr:hypothetical protein [Sporosarcina aquimarina]MDW0108772.1 hypothetical protein [Sporosarcina aquimarina]